MKHGGVALEVLKKTV